MPDLLALNGQIIGGVPMPGDNYIKLWENPDPTASFAAQDIILSSDDYDFLLITYRNNGGNKSCLIEKGQGAILSDCATRGSSVVTVYDRSISYVTDTKLSSSGAYEQNSGSARSANNADCIPFAIYGIKKDALAVNGGGTGGGHVIEDAEGTDLDQQDTLQFKGTLRATNDAQNGKTIVDDSAVEIEWDDWQTMSEQEREAYLAEHPKVDILNFPDANGEIDVELFTKLWENPDPTVAFESQYIDLLSDDYDFLLCISKIYTNVGTQSSVIASKGSIFQLIFSDDGSVETRTRKFAYVSDTRLSINDAYANGTKNNNYCIPLFIYGFKKKVTVGIDAIAENVSTLASKCMLEDGETSVEDALGWHYLGQTTGATEIDIPENATEVICSSAVSSTVIQFNFATIQDDINVARQGFYSAANNYGTAMFKWIKSTRKANLYNFSFAGTDYTSSATSKWYIKVK